MSNNHNTTYICVYKQYLFTALQIKNTHTTYKTLSEFAKLFESNFKLSKADQNFYTNFYNTLQNSTKLYTTIHNFIFARLHIFWFLKNTKKTKLDFLFQHSTKLYNNFTLQTLKQNNWTQILFTNYTSL